MTELTTRAVSAPKTIVLFGVRSPMVVEYEDVCSRTGISIIAAVNVSGTPRLAKFPKIVALRDIGGRFAGLPCIPVAFSPKRRRELSRLASEGGLIPSFPLIDPSAVLSPSSRIGDGSFINAGVVIGALSITGSYCLINRSSSIGHHTVIEDFVSIGPGVTLASNIRVGEGALIGAGATVLPNVEIGAGSIVAAGSVVRKTVKPGELVSGNPARSLKAAATRARLDLRGRMNEDHGKDVVGECFRWGRKAVSHRAAPGCILWRPRTACASCTCSFSLPGPHER